MTVISCSLRRTYFSIWHSALMDLWTTTTAGPLPIRDETCKKYRNRRRGIDGGICKLVDNNPSLSSSWNLDQLHPGSVWMLNVAECNKGNMALSILSHQRLKWHVLCISSVSQLASSESSFLESFLSFSLPGPWPPARRIWSIRCRADSETTANNTKQCKRSYGQYISRYRRTKAIPSGSCPPQPARQWPLVVDLVLLGLKYFGIGEVSSINAHTRGILLTGGWVMLWWRLLFSKIKLSSWWW